MDHTAASPADGAREPFRRSEHALSHIVYGLILAVATLGELIDHEVGALDAAAALYATGLVLLVAHLFSDVFAQMLAREEEVEMRNILRIGHRDLAVTLGGAVMGTMMLVAHLADADPSVAMGTCFVAAMGWLGIQTYTALRRDGMASRLLMSALAVVLALVIVWLENVH